MSNYKGGHEALRTGVVSEVKAQLVMFQQGYEVFTPLNANARQDFLASKDGKIYRVQVKTAQYNGDYIQARLDIRGARYTEQDTDLVIFVLDQRMWIVPIEFITGAPSVCLGKVGDDGYRPQKDYTQFEVR